MTYDKAGHRTSATTYSNQMVQKTTTNDQVANTTTTVYSFGSFGKFKDVYSYDGLGRLIATDRGGNVTVVTKGSNGGTSSSSFADNLLRVDGRKYDNAGRELIASYQSTDSTTWGVANTTDLREHSRTSQYDDDGRLTLQSTGISTNGVIQANKVQSTVDYSSSTSYDAAARLKSYTARVFTGSADTTGTTSTYTNNFVAAERYMDGGQTVKDANNNTTGSTTRTYNANNELVAFENANSATSNRYFLNGTTGQPLVVIQGDYRDQTARSNAFKLSQTRDDNTLKAQYYFYSQGNNIGTFGQLQGHDAAGASNGFTANFDVNYQPISDAYPASTPSQVIAQAGDTLYLIAQRLYGDAALWYLIAEENGLSDPTQSISAGTVLRVPSKVISLANTYGIYKPFNLFDAVGNTSPAQMVSSSSAAYSSLANSIALYGNNMLPAGYRFTDGMTLQEKIDLYNKAWGGYSQDRALEGAHHDEIQPTGDSDSNSLYWMIAAQTQNEVRDFHAGERAANNLQKYRDTNPTTTQLQQHLNDHPDENKVAVEFLSNFSKANPSFDWGNTAKAANNSRRNGDIQNYERITPSDGRLNRYWIEAFDRFYASADQSWH